MKKNWKNEAHQAADTTAQSAYADFNNSIKSSIIECKELFGDIFPKDERFWKQVELLAESKLECLQKKFGVDYEDPLDSDEAVGNERFYIFRVNSETGVYTSVNSFSKSDEERAYNSVNNFEKKDGHIILAESYEDAKLILIEKLGNKKSKQKKLKSICEQELIKRIRSHLIHWRIIEQNKEVIGEQLCLSGFDLSGFNFSTLFIEVWQKYVSINWASSNPGIATNSRLWEVDFSQSEISGCNFTSCDLRGANFSNTTGKGVKFNDCNLELVRFHGANLDACDFYACNMEQIMTSSTLMKACNFIKCKLHRISFSGSLLSSRFTKCEITRMSLFNVTLTDVSFLDTVFNFDEMKNVDCKFFFQDGSRFPQKRDFKKYEFQKLYRKMHNFDLFFEEGISLGDTIACNVIANIMNKEHPEWSVFVDSINFRSGSPYVRFSFMDETIEGMIEGFIRTNFDSLKIHISNSMLKLEGLQEEFMKKISGKVDNNSGTTINYNAPIKGLIHGDNATIIMNEDNRQQLATLDEEVYKKLLGFTKKNQLMILLPNLLRKKPKMNLLVCMQVK